MSHSTTVLIGRILLALIFIMAGLGKIGDPANNAAYFESLGLPMAAVMVWLVVAFEVLAGIAILIGFMTRPAAYLLALFCIASALLAHFDFGDQIQMIMFLKNLAIAGGFLVLAANGPGSISLDAKRAG
ncbi:DoxX family protein [Hoeflea prorocentri]|uniref:DoxX family protein n=1 Tax=Hoeflea prorocentri TaxID=1922333 RepID=A0A9X3UK38_9HYPH|nr:DoxX family protein [Hoeflea prorocentri]MCY6382270.1 DoxX family protein [Hoeflea prorocentri]MDA5400070.1 DoxX family protein [Hoeflea prorocentri]